LEEIVPEVMTFLGAKGNRGLIAQIVQNVLANETFQAKIEEFLALDNFEDLRNAVIEALKASELAGVATNVCAVVKGSAALPAEFSFPSPPQSNGLPPPPQQRRRLFADFFTNLLGNFFPMSDDVKAIVNKLVGPAAEFFLSNPRNPQPLIQAVSDVVPDVLKVVEGLQAGEVQKIVSDAVSALMTNTAFTQGVTDFFTDEKNWQIAQKVITDLLANDQVKTKASEVCAELGY
jgi:hypothetical protein